MDITELLKDRIDSVEITLDLTPEEFKQICDIYKNKNCFEFKLDNLGIFNMTQRQEPYSYSTDIKFVNMKKWSK